MLAAAGRRAGSAGRGHARRSRSLLGAGRSRGPVRAAAAQPGDMGWVIAPPRRPVRAGVRLRRALRGAGGGDRRASSSSASIRSASAAGSPRRTARSSARSSSSRSRRPSPSCGSCSSSRRRAASASARASSPSASASRARRATGRSRSGPIACSWPRGASTRARDIASSTGAASQLRPRPGRGDLGAAALMRGAAVKPSLRRGRGGRPPAPGGLGHGGHALRRRIRRGRPPGAAPLRDRLRCLLPFVLSRRPGRDSRGAICCPSRSSASRSSAC